MAFELLSRFIKDRRLVGTKKPIGLAEAKSQSTWCLSRATLRQAAGGKLLVPILMSTTFGEKFEILFGASPGP